MSRQDVVVSVLVVVFIWAVLASNRLDPDPLWGVIHATTFMLLAPVLIAAGLLIMASPFIIFVCVRRVIPSCWRMR